MGNKILKIGWSLFMMVCKFIKDRIVAKEICYLTIIHILSTWIFEKVEVKEWLLSNQ